MSKPKFAHNVFQTAHHEAMRDWYCTVLDGHVVYEDATLTFLTFDDEHHRVALLHPPIEFQAKTATTAALHHSAYTFDSIDALLERYTMLRDKGITPLPFTSRTSVSGCPVFSVALRVSHDCGRRSGADVNATRPLL